MSCLLAGDEGVRELSSVMDHGWIGRHCDTVVDVSPPQRDVDAVERQPETEVETETTSGCVLNGRSPTPPASEAVGPTSAGTSVLIPEVKEGWSPEMTSQRGSWESDGMSDAWSSVTSVPGLDDNRAEVLDGEKDREGPEAADGRAIIVVSDSNPTPPPPNLVASSEPGSARKGTEQSPPGPATTSAAAASFDESVVRKLESFVESMNVRRCAAKPSTIGWPDAVTSSAAAGSGLGRQAFPVCRPLQPLNGLRGGGRSGGVLLPFYVPFKTGDAAERPLDLSSKIGRTPTAMSDTTAAFVQVTVQTSRSIISTLFGRWQQRCGLSLAVLLQYCHLPNKLENIERTADIPYTLQ